MKVVLLGYMGVGKSTLGRVLADSLKFIFFDLDTYIENKEGLSIPELFKTKGEIYFRKQESYYLKEILSRDVDIVLSLGGGTPVYGNNMKEIVGASNTISVYLKLQLNELVSKLYHQKLKRPLIAHYQDESEFEEFVRKHLFERQQFYFLADHVLDLTGKNVNESLSELLGLLNENT
ncbi:shikimate kinase [Psychroflexus sp. CAK8W]|uniref:Shikimate kinase n=1 Tax=Psychroflexus longus TaxID=2873596 RepID=A0ABS7XEC4_9FLAO|nr:shikimate kinase [Psychroflexus longus]MBZ9777297.1 shikimate kinase [Psychroflexus longus]